MKSSLLVFLLFISLNYAFAQTDVSFHAKGIEGCYTEYYIAFTERGANPVTDGQHDVVISVIHQGKSECYLGKATVKGGKFINPVMIQKDDMSLVPLNTIFQSLNQNWLEEQDMSTLNNITDGMTNMFVTKDNYELRMFFYTFIHQNVRANRKAPPADVLLKK
ncbi:hypothetical protein M3O96_12745 [Aquiflexum sp. TKW24L]|uniref:hypothetical protein n=1 Tax=Aquiflexum sp. TKW24L TaxID=2942212 RepID=UPI0020BE22D4|nr:hypothetical protein [Aquiflexum sp. TKW24L]MCL6259964.1 hypothetical protein [Aquiflexum sp. TKW24L]